MHHSHCPLCSASTHRFVHPALPHTGLTGCRHHSQRGVNHHTTCTQTYHNSSVSHQRHACTCRRRAQGRAIPACQRTPATTVNHYCGPTHVTSLQRNLVPQQYLAPPSNANASLMLQNKELLSKVAGLETALVQHKPIPQQPLALPSNVIASPTPQNNKLQPKVSNLEAALQKAEQDASSARTELAKMSNLETALQKAKQEVGFAKVELSKVSHLQTALQKAEQEASSAKTELLEMQANLVKANEQAAKEASENNSAQNSIAPGFDNFDVTVRAKAFVDRK